MKKRNGVGEKKPFFWQECSKAGCRKGERERKCIYDPDYSLEIAVEKGRLKWTARMI